MFNGTQPGGQGVMTRITLRWCLYLLLSLFALCWFFMDGGESTLRARTSSGACRSNTADSVLCGCDTVVTIGEATVMLIIYATYILVTFFGPLGA